MMMINSSRTISALGIFLFFFVISCQEALLPYDVSDNAESCLVIIPDIQNYSDNSSRFSYLEQIASFCSSSNDYNVVASFQVGDLTNNNHVWQYENVRDHFFSLFPKERYPIFCLGNHDYGNNGNSMQRYSNIPMDLFYERDFVMNPDQPENYVRHIYVNGKPYAVLVLEFAPRNEALEWANKIINAEPSTPFIILTHAFLNRFGQLFDASDVNCDKVGSQKSYYLGGDIINDSMEIFRKIIYGNINVKFVICGHSFSPNYMEYKSVINKQGSKVHCIMVNYQAYKDGGSGYVGCLFIHNNKCRLQAYSSVEEVFNEEYVEFELN